jgi:hypothetical protein
LRDDQFIAAHLDAVQRSSCLLEIVAAIRRLGQHDLSAGVTGLQGDRLFQPFLRIVKPVGQQRDAAQAEDCRKVLGISGHAHVEFAGFGKLPNLEEPIGRTDFRLLRLGCRLS